MSNLIFHGKNSETLKTLPLLSLHVYHYNKNHLPVVPLQSLQCHSIKLVIAFFFFVSFYLPFIFFPWCQCFTIITFLPHGTSLLISSLHLSLHYLLVMSIPHHHHFFLFLNTSPSTTLLSFSSFPSLFSLNSDTSSSTALFLPSLHHLPSSVIPHHPQPFLLLLPSLHHHPLTSLTIHPATETNFPSPWAQHLSEGNTQTFLIYTRHQH